MTTVDGGHLVVKALKTEGVQHLFVLSGNHNQSILNACLDETVNVIDTRHEHAAVQIADGWARVTGQPGVALVTAGVGTINAMPGMAVAFQSASPVVLIAPQIPLYQIDTGHGQQLDQLQLLRPITKWAATCHETQRIPEYISMAFRHACSGRQGPVFVEIPSDVLETSVAQDSVPFPFAYRTTSKPEGDAPQVQQAVELLLDSERPLVIAGSGVWWSGAGDELRAFIEAAQIPLSLSMMGRGCVAEDHPLCFGPIRAGAKRADVILVLGARLNQWLANGRPPLFGTDQTWIQVDIDASEIGRNRPINIGIVGDVKAVLRQMIKLVRLKGTKGRDSWIEECREYVRERRKRIETNLTSDRAPIHPLRLCKEIGDFLSRDATIIVDGGDIAIFAIQALRVNHPGHWLDNGNLGFLGAGVPFGIAAKLARPNKQVLVLSGDGSFGFNSMEFDTAIRHNVPIVAVVGNDSAWGMIKHRQQAIYGPHRVVGTELGFTRYHDLVESLGGYGECVERPQDIAKALQRAFSSNRPACINVRIDPDAVSPVTARTSKER